MPSASDSAGNPVPDFAASRRVLWIALAVATVARLVVFGAFARDPALFVTPDTGLYVDLAKHLAEEGEFVSSTEGGAPHTFRTPGYPAFLAAGRLAFGDRAWPVILVQIALGLAAIALTWRLVGEMFHPYAGGFAALLLALSPTQAYQSCLLVTEALFTPLLVAGVFALWRFHESLSARPVGPRPWALALASGLLFGLAVLTRPFGILLPGVALLFLGAALWKRPGALALGAALWIAGFALPVGGWIARNHAKAGVAAISSIGGYNLLDSRATGVLMAQEGITYEEASARLFSELDRRMAERGLEPGEVRLGHTTITAGPVRAEFDHDPVTYEAARTAEARRMALEMLRENPGVFAANCARSLASLYLGANGAFFHRLFRGSVTVEPLGGVARLAFFGWAGAQLAGLCLAYALALLAVAHLIRRRSVSRFVLFVGLSIYPFALLVGAVTAHSRYRAPFEPYLAALAGAGLAVFARRFHPRPAPLPPLPANPRTLVMIPVYDEAEKIRRLLDEFPFDLVDRVVIVDDGSSDGSQEIVTRYPVRVIRHETNRGIGVGIRETVAMGRAEGLHVMVVMAGNGKDDPREIPLVLAPILERGRSYVHGSRFLAPGHEENTPTFRSVAIRLYSRIFNLFAPAPCTDVTNGFRAYRLDLLARPEFDLDQPWLDRYEMEYYVHFKAWMLGHDVEEVAVHKRYPADKTVSYSKIRAFRDWWKMVRPMVFLFLGWKR